MAQEIQVDPMLVVGPIIFFIVLAVVFLIVLILEINFFKKKKYALAIGGIIGSILAITNGFALGVLGYLFWLPFSFFCRGGESCWGWAIYVGSAGFLVLGFLIGWIFERIKSKKQE